MNKKIIYINFTVVAILAIAVVYLVLQNQKIISSIIAPAQDEAVETEPTLLPSQASPSASPGQITEQTTEQAILDFTNDTDRTDLSQFLADSVNVTLNATDCCDPMTKEQAINQLSYINEGLPITFDQKNTTVVNLKAKNPNLSQTYMGISQTREHMIAYTIDPQTAKITGVQMSVSWKLYNQ